MRVTSGKFKGRLLKMPKGVKIRPTSQKVKQALFNILGEAISGASFLELFAGSGAIGIGALSRGAGSVVFVENNRLCLKAIHDNLKGIGAGKGRCFKILAVSAEEAIETLAQKKERFDFIFLDPPYYQDSSRTCGQGRDTLKNCLIKLKDYDILSPRSYVVAEHSKRQALPKQIAQLRLMFTKSYGDTALSLYRKQP